tara:strand:- start:576 stop:752 length:177 start_codon:yes stop_codon:yes gene_type:complete
MESIFWKDGFNGKAQGGLFFRNTIGKDIEKMQTKIDGNIVGIKIDTNDLTIEFITEKV